MGDPRFVPGQSYDVGTSTTKGLYARDPVTQSCDKYASIIQSYCDKNDARCASGDSLLVHLSYTVKYNDAALAFVLKKLGVSSKKTVE
jgi:acetylxylan esterase